MHCDPGWLLINTTCINVSVAGIVISSAAAVIGWILGWVSRVSFEGRRIRHEKDVRLEAVRREAIESAQRWIDPMITTVTKASLISMSYMYGVTDADALKRKWPTELKATLATLDVPPHLRSYLPDSTQKYGNAIVDRVRTLRRSVLDADRGTEEGITYVVKMFVDLQDMVSRLSSQLENAHRSTLE
jgi:hypothetical protein